MPRRHAASHRALALAAASSLLAACAAAPVVQSANELALPDVPALSARCARGFPVACRDLGRAALVGDGLPRDDRLAAALLTKACEIGDAAACGDLSVLAAIGRGVKQSDARAVGLARRACDAGSALACSNLGVMTVEGVNRLELRPDEQGEEGAKTVRLFRTACDAGASEGCLNLGTALESGQLANRDAPGAAAAYQRSCDLGLALGCYRLATLSARFPQAHPGAPLAALHTAACQDAVAPACDLAGRPTPRATARTPTARLVDEPRSLALGIPGTGGFHPTDLWPAPPSLRTGRDEARRPRPALLAATPPALRGRLGLERPPRDEAPPDQAVELLIALRRHELGRCYEAVRSSPGVRAEAFVAFLVEADGRPAEVRAASAPADAELEVCAAEVVGDWEFPVPVGGLGGPYLARFDFDAAPPGPAPEFAPPDGLRPALRQPGCLERSLRIPADFREAVGSVTVKVAVDTAGRSALLHAVTPVPEALEPAIAEAVRACAWSPGADARGRPATLWATVPIRIEPR